MPLREIINATIDSKFDDKLKEDIVNNQFDALKQKMDEYIGDNRNQLTEVNQDIATLRKEMEAVKNLAEKLKGLIATENSRVALTACLLGANFHTKAGKPIKFTNIKTSIGMTDLSAYKSTGTFICTVAGLYHVSAVMVSATNNAAIRIYKNNEVIITTYYGKTDGYPETSTSVFVKMLDVGDEITVGTASNQYIYEHSCFTIVKLN
ncbi:uncharacterized protein LOC134684798 [Mytilus trossulus]|uniref:uncharacterized protein LOC134684798 n=1 Tax=Mytilus trossulus TaxID=6551 RepID=UPI003007027F